MVGPAGSSGDHQEDDECHQDEVDDGGQKGAQAQSYGSRDLLVPIHNGGLQDDIQLAQVDAADDQTDQRHEHIVDQGGGDFAEGGAQHHADGHVQHIAAHGKFLEFIEKLFHMVPPLSAWG